MTETLFLGLVLVVFCGFGAACWRGSTTRARTCARRFPTRASEAPQPRRPSPIGATQPRAQSSPTMVPAFFSMAAAASRQTSSR
jgi:hypothetical protein